MLNNYCGLIYRKLSQQLLRFYFTTSLWQFQMKWLKLRELIGLVHEILCWYCNPDEPGKYYGNFCHFIRLWLKPVLVAFVNYNWSRNGHCRYGYETNVSIYWWCCRMAGIMSASMLAITPPIIVLISMQKLFVRGLIDSEN